MCSTTPRVLGWDGGMFGGVRAGLEGLGEETRQQDDGTSVGRVLTHLLKKGPCSVSPTPKNLAVRTRS